MRVPSMSVAIVVTTVSAALSLGGVAEAAKSPVRGGVIHACLKMKGKPSTRGALRVVPSARACKKKRGEKAIAWNVSGPTGSPGAPGGNGGQGPAGPQGAPGAQGQAGQVSQTLIETVQSQSLQIEALEGQVVDLTDELLDVKGTVGAVEGTVASLGTTVTGVQSSLTGLASDLVDVEATASKACEQVNPVTGQSNSLITAVGGLTLSGIVGGLLNIPKLPAALPTVPC